MLHSSYLLLNAYDRYILELQVVPAEANSKSNLMPLLKELKIEESHSFKKNVLGIHIMLGIRDTNVPSWSSQIGKQ